MHTGRGIRSCGPYAQNSMSRDEKRPKSEQHEIPRCRMVFAHLLWACCLQSCQLLPICRLYSWRYEMKIDLSGKTALVTGSTSGIGHAIARGLAAAGAGVVINGRTQDKVDAVAASIGKSASGGKARGVAADVATAAGCEALVAALPDVDILVNNAGIFEAKDFL